MSPITWQFLHLFRMEPIFWKLLHMFKIEAFWKFLHVLGASFLKFFTWTKWRLFAESPPFAQNGANELKVLPRVQNDACFLKFSTCSKWRLFSEVLHVFKMAPMSWKFFHVFKMAPVFWSSPRVQDGAHYGGAAAAVPGRHCQPLFNCGAFS